MLRTVTSLAFIVAAASCGGAHPAAKSTTPAPTTNTPPLAEPFDVLINTELSVEEREGVATIRAPSKLAWMSVVDVLDHLKQKGTIRFVLAATDRAPDATKEITFPSMLSISALYPSTTELGPNASSLTQVKIGRDGGPTEVNGNPVASLNAVETALGGTASGSLVVISADRETPFGAVLSVVNVVQRCGGRVLFSVVALSTATLENMRKPRPKQSSFDGCPFPPEADAAAIDQASVTVEVEIDLSGRARSARTINDPGHGFARAAQACALAASYEPGRDTSGAFVEGTVKLSIRFDRPPPNRARHP